MQSSGGVMTRDYLRAAPVRSLASGPAGGVIGAARFGVSKGAPDLLCVDMGGTSYDVSVVRRGEAPAQPGWNWHHRHVIGLPMVSVETLGAGGGSLCDATGGALRVGPESAGADPGPVCYGRGGARPTVTDAMLVLGFLSDEAEFAGGRFRLTRKGVAEAFAEHVAGPLGCSVEQAAFDCWRVVNANMTQAVQRWTALRGIDPRDLSMVAYGGNGPLFAAIQAQELGIDRVLVPRTSPAFSALGALAAAPSVDEERSYLVTARDADTARIRALFAELAERARRFLADAGFAPAAVAQRPQMSLRYPGQNWSLAIDVAVDADDAALREGAIEAFHRRHEQEYGHARPGEEPEITGVRLVSSADTPKPAFASGFTAKQRHPAPIATRSANLGRGFEKVAVHRGASLAPGDAVAGPAIIEESYTTIAVYPGWEARVDDAGDRVLVRSSG
jgi:N-methylhydantoinase A